MQNHQQKTLIMLALVICLCIGVAGLHGYYKEYFYEDEVLSYTISNSKNGGYFNLKANEWYRGSDLYDNLYVKKGEGFDWSNTLRNLKTDDHPPLYYLTLHAFSSFCSGGFSKWSGISINLIIFALMLIVLYLTFHELFPERPYFPVLLCGLCGMNLGILGIAIYIRMYMQLILATVLCMYWHVTSICRCKTKQTDSLAKERFFWPIHALLVAVTLYGTMTHYFYLIFAFYAALFYCIYMLYRKYFIRVLAYVLSMAVAAGIVLTLWNPIIQQLFSEDAGSDTMGQQWSASLIRFKISGMTNLLNEEVFSGKLKYVLIILLIFFVYHLVKERHTLITSLKVRPEIVLILFTIILFYLTASVITPYTAYRYVCPATVFIILITVSLLEKTLNNILKSSLLGLICISLFFIQPEVSSIKSGLVDVNRQIIDAYSSEHQNDICLYYAGITPEENVFELRKFDRIYTFNELNFSEVSGLRSADEILLYIPDGEEPQKYVEAIQTENPSLKYVDRLYVAYYSTCYIISTSETT